MTVRMPIAAARAAVAAALIALGQGSALAQDMPMILPVDPVPLTVDDKSFTIEIADAPDERARGLMFRQTMADDHGMLFIFENTRPVGFWMKNTPMPLDLIFVGEDGKVRAVLPGEPFSTAPIGPKEPVRFVLEVKRGIAAKAGIDAGDRMSHPAIDGIAGAP